MAFETIIQLIGTIIFMFYLFHPHNIPENIQNINMINENIILAIQNPDHHLIDIADAGDFSYGIAHILFV